MKKIVLITLALIAGVILWLLEPYRYNPFYKPDPPTVKTSIDYHCQTGLEKILYRAESVMAQYMLSEDFLGVSAGFYKNGCGSLTAAIGFSDKRNLIEFKPTTITRIASITKPMTAIAIMQLYEAGKVDIDASIQTYLPRFPQGLKTVTIRHLLSHTSGVGHYKSKLDAMSFSHYDSLKQATEEIYKRGLLSPAGEQFIYSSFGYTVLGEVIESVTKQSFEAYLQEYIWQKAGMDNTSLEKSQILQNKSRLYIKVDDIFVRSPYTDLSLIYPGGGVQSTAQDLLNFGNAILENKLVSKSTLDMMTDVRNSLAPEVGDDPYGLGWSVLEHPEYGKIISHSGAQPGVSGQFLIFLDKEVVAVALSNAFGTKNSVRSLALIMGELGIKAHYESEPR